MVLPHVDGSRSSSVEVEVEHGPAGRRAPRAPAPRRRSARRSSARSSGWARSASARSAANGGVAPTVASASPSGLADAVGLADEPAELEPRHARGRLAVEHLLQRAIVDELRLQLLEQRAGAGVVALGRDVGHAPRERLDLARDRQLVVGAHRRVVGDARVVAQLPQATASSRGASAPSAFSAARTWAPRWPRMGRCSVSAPATIGSSRPAVDARRSGWGTCPRCARPPPRSAAARAPPPGRARRRRRGAASRPARATPARRAPAPPRTPSAPPRRRAACLVAHRVIIYAIRPCASPIADGRGRHR